MKSSFSRFKTKYRLAGFESLEPRRVLATEGEWVTIERTLDTSALSGNISGTISWNDGTQSAAQVISQPSSGALRIRFDYSLDSSGFFADQSRRQLLQLAADIVTTKFSDTLAAIAPSGVNQWNASFQNPSTGQMTSVANLTIAANELVVYVGARNLSGNTLGLASTGGYSAGGTQAFLDLVKARGQTGALASTPTDYGPWGGSLFGPTPVGISAPARSAWTQQKMIFFPLRSMKFAISLDSVQHRVGPLISVEHNSLAVTPKRNMTWAAMCPPTPFACTGRKEQPIVGKKHSWIQPSPPVLARI